MPKIVKQERRNKPVTVRMTSTLYRMLKAEANRRGLSQQEVIRTALSADLTERSQS